MICAWKADLKMQMNNKQLLSMFNKKIIFDLSYSFRFNVVTNEFLYLSVLNCNIDTNNVLFLIWIYDLMKILNKKEIKCLKEKQHFVVSIIDYLSLRYFFD